MATNKVKLDIAKSLFSLVTSYVNEGVISREEAAEVVKALGECIQLTNQKFIREGKSDFITKAKPSEETDDVN